MRTRYVVLPALSTLVLALFAFGCGGGGSSGGDPATLAPAKSPVFIEATITPEGELKSNIESLGKLAGVDDVEGLIFSELEKSATESGNTLDFEKEVQPWLGEKAGIYLGEYDGNDFQQAGGIVATTDAEEAQAFIDKSAKNEAGVEDATYEGVDYKLTGDGTALGMIGDFLAVGENEASFKAMVDAEGGESLADEDAYTTAAEEVVDGSLADAYVDIGALIKETGDQVDDETKVVLEGVGVNPYEATALASLIPGSDQIEVDFSSDVFEKPQGEGDASKLLESLPGGSLAAFASADFGKNLKESIDRLDARGIPGQLEPNELKAAMSAAGIDLDKIGGSIGDIGVFAQGNTERNLTGALVMQTTGADEATNAVSNIGLLLRASGTPGVTTISGQATGFSVRSPDLGRQPLVVAAKGDKIAISYGLAASAQALSASTGATLAGDPAFKEAKTALGETPISGFLDGPAALALVNNLIPSDEKAEYERAVPYLEKISYAAFGSAVADDKSTARMIVGLTK